MPITIAKIKCNECEDIIEATSESWSMCKCEKTEVLPKKWFTSYRHNKKNCFTLLESKTYYYEDDFLIFDNEMQILYDEIKSVAKTLDFREYSYFEKGKDGKEFLESTKFEKGEMNGRYAVTSNTVQLNINLSKEYGRPNREEIISRMKSFKTYLSKMENGDIDMKNRKSLLDYSDEEDVYWSREQLNEYDYTFSF